MNLNIARPVFRFAPSPNGRLHLGHALSALENQQRAQAVDGRLLLRVEDIDRARCTPELEAGVVEDLTWLGVSFDGTVFRQSEHFADYQSMLQSLIDRALAYPAFMTRSEVKRHVGESEGQGGHGPAIRMARRSIPIAIGGWIYCGDRSCWVRACGMPGGSTWRRRSRLLAGRFSGGNKPATVLSA
nr:glutamate--tRNA ligase family protein [Marinicella sp. W31]MDC2878344.1 glutamate--tRNA ligase family protein [Marinicella sp. W31]